MWKCFFLKALAKNYFLTWKCCSWPTFYQLREKVMICSIFYITKSRLDVQFVKKIRLEKFNRWKKRGMIKINNGFYIERSIHLQLTCCEPQITPTFKGGTFVSYAVLQCLSLLHSFAKYSQNPGSAHCRFVQIFDKGLKCLIYLGCWGMKHWKYLVFEKDAKADMNLVELKFAKLSR